MRLKDLHTQVASFQDTLPMPILFIGHGSPMNAIENNEFSRMWTTLGSRLPRPKAIVCISAHWETRGTSVTTNSYPETIHDFYGFPNKLYEERYNAAGSPQLAQEIVDNITHSHIKGDDSWGLDHGSWTLLKYIYPLADIPVIQISLDRTKDALWHYQLGQELAFLRSKGVLVIGSGNMIHNLSMMRLAGDDFNAEYGYDWAFELNDIMRNKIVENDFDSLIQYNTLHKNVKLAIPTPEHYIPMLYILGMREKDEEISIFNDKVIAASLNMTSFIIGRNIS